MAKWETVVVVKRPVRDVFAFVIDPQHSSKWHRSSEIIPHSDEPIHVGSSYRVTGRFLVWNFDSETVVSEYEENQVVAFESNSGPFPYVLRYVFEPVTGGTRLTEIGEAHPPAMMKFAMRLFIGTARNNGERGLSMLKSYLEQDTG